MYSFPLIDTVSGNTPFASKYSFTVTAAFITSSTVTLSVETSEAGILGLNLVKYTDEPDIFSLPVTPQKSQPQ